MQVITDYCSQKRAYGDSSGECVILLENDETIEDVINKYIKPVRNWWEKKYSNARSIPSYITRKYNRDLKGMADITFTDNLIIMNTSQVYLD